MDEMMKPQWYVVHTYSGYENKVAQDLQTMVENRRLQDMICDVNIPTEMVLELKEKKVKEKVSEVDDFGRTVVKTVTHTVTEEVEVERKVFPGYVFVKMVMTDDTWYIVRNIRGCTGFVGPASTKPVPLTDAEVEKMGISTRAELSVGFEVGDIVQIKSGSMEGFTGKVEEINIPARTAKLTVNMFGRETPTEIDLAQIELL